MTRRLDHLRHASGGEGLDVLGHEAIRLAHAVLERFPEIVRRHKFIAGGAAISSSLVVLAGAAVVRRMRAGVSPADAVGQVTANEINGPSLISDRARIRVREDAIG
jgi:hypothetical protein